MRLTLKLVDFEQSRWALLISIAYMNLIQWAEGLNRTERTLPAARENSPSPAFLCGWPWLSCVSSPPAHLAKCGLSSNLFVKSLVALCFCKTWERQVILEFHFWGLGNYWLTMGKSWSPNSLLVWWLPDWSYNKSGAGVLSGDTEMLARNPLTSPFIHSFISPSHSFICQTINEYLLWASKVPDNVLCNERLRL